MKVKVEASKVKCLLEVLDAMFNGIVETVHSGDDGMYDSCLDQQKDFRKAWKEFELQHLIGEMPEVKVPEHAYLKFDAGRFPIDHQWDAHENTMKYMQDLYRHIKKRLRETTEDYSHILQQGALFNKIEEIAIVDTVYASQIYTQNWFHSTIKVIADIEDEILEHRRRNPQHVLFQ